MNTGTQYSHRGVWRIAAPLILSNLSVPLLGITDTAVMGHLDRPEYLGAVAIGSTIFNVVFMGLNFLRMGTTGLTAQAYGRRDGNELRTVLAQSVLTALGLAGILLLIQFPVIRLALSLLDPSPAVAELADRYYSIRIWSAPAVLVNYAVIGWLIGMQDARKPLTLMLTVNIMNIVLDLLLVPVLGFGIEGVAIASLIAEWTGLVVGLTLVHRGLTRWPGSWQRDAILDTRRYKRLFRLNIDLLIRTLSLMFAFAFVTAQSARLGDLVLAANAILLNFQHLMAYALDGFAHAAEALVGKAIGARDRNGLLTAIRSSRQWSVVVAIVFCAAYALTGHWLLRLMTDQASVTVTATEYLPWLVVSPFISVWSFLYDGVYVGATRSHEMRNTMLFSTFVVFLPAWWLLRPLGNHGLWLAFMLFMAARGITMHVLLRRVPVFTY